MDEILERIHASVNLREAVAEANIVIEAVFEDVHMKKEIFKEIDEAGPGDAVLASNTSTLWIAELAAATLPTRSLYRHPFPDTRRPDSPGRSGSGA